MLRLDTPVTQLPQVSDARSKALSELGIKNIRQLLNHFPERYIDLSAMSSILDARIGFNYTISATVHSIEEKEPKPGLKLIEITLTDDTGTLIATAFNQKWLLDTVKPQDKVAVSGKVEFNYGFKRMTNPFIHVLSDEDTINDIAKVVPIHSGNENISSSWVRNIVRNAFEYLGNLDSFVPTELRNKYKLMDGFKALRDVHFPNTMEDLSKAKRTLKYSQALSYFTYWIKELNCFQNNNLCLCEFFDDKVDKCVEAISLYKENKKQSVMIIPNSVSVLQYKEAFEEKLSKLHVTFQIIDENTSKENRWKAIYDFKNGDLDLILGTSVLLDEDIDNKNLALIVVDEKTEFVPSEFNKVKKLSNKNSDITFLSTRPLPDNLASILYPGSVVNRIPYKQSYKCEISVWERELRMSAFEQAVEKLKNSGQVLVFTPDVSFKIEEMQNKIFNGWNIAYINDKNSPKDVMADLENFNSGKLDVLICSRDIDFSLKPKSSCFVIVEDADRMGLSKLHQIRNFAIASEGECNMHLVSSTKRKETISKLNQLGKTMDGKTIVLSDLKDRAEGANLGFNKWGMHALNLIKVYDDEAIINTAYNDAKEIISKDPTLNEKENSLLRFEISRIFED